VRDLTINHIRAKSEYIAVKRSIVKVEADADAEAQRKLKAES